jgi:putative copper export protein
MTTALLILARLLQFGSGLVLVNMVGFRWLILLPAYRGATEKDWQSLRLLHGRFQKIFLCAAVMLVLSGLLLFWAVSAGMNGTSLGETFDRQVLATVLFQTQFGTVCQLRLGLALVFGFCLWRVESKQWQFRRTASLPEVGAGVMAIGLLGSMAWMGHAAAGGADDGWRLAPDVLHLLAAAIWPAGLLPFAFFLRWVRRQSGDVRVAPVLNAVRRFSAVSLVAVLILAATGLVNATFLVGSFTSLLTTPYGWWLCLKLFLFFLILCVAAWNRYRILPLLFISPEEKVSDRAFYLMGRLQTFVLTEFSLAVAVIAVVSVLGITAPPR